MQICARLFDFARTCSHLEYYVQYSRSLSKNLIDPMNHRNENGVHSYTGRIWSKVPDLPNVFAPVPLAYATPDLCPYSVSFYAARKKNRIYYAAIVEPTRSNVALCAVTKKGGQFN